jgi:hypothetical protein
MWIHKFQRPWNHPKERIQHSKHTKSLKLRKIYPTKLHARKVYMLIDSNIWLEFGQPSSVLLSNHLSLHAKGKQYRHRFFGA